MQQPERLPGTDSDEQSAGHDVDDGHFDLARAGFRLFAEQEHRRPPPLHAGYDAGGSIFFFSWIGFAERSS